jgi:repressor LexA
MLVMNEKQNWGFIIKKLREQKGLQQQELADISHVARSQLNRIEHGRVKSYKGDVLERLARGLQMATKELHAELYGINTNQETGQPKSVRGILDELELKYQALKLVEIPIKGIVPAGKPFIEEQITGEYIEVPEVELMGTNIKTLYALKISGNSLQGDKIYDGFYVIIKPTQDIINGQIYILRFRSNNETVARHVYKENDHLRLISSNGEYTPIKATDVEIQGQIILKGGWDKP